MRESETPFHFRAGITSHHTQTAAAVDDDGVMG